MHAANILLLMAIHYYMYITNFTFFYNINKIIFSFFSLMLISIQSLISIYLHFKYKYMMAIEYYKLKISTIQKVKDTYMSAYLHYSSYCIHAVIFYSCILMGDNCGQCLSIASKFECGYCSTSSCIPIRLTECNGATALSGINDVGGCPTPTIERVRKYFKFSNLLCLASFIFYIILGSFFVLLPLFIFLFSL